MTWAIELTAFADILSQWSPWIWTATAVYGVIIGVQAAALLKSAKQRVERTVPEGTVRNRIIGAQREARFIVRIQGAKLAMFVGIGVLNLANKALSGEILQWVRILTLVVLTVTPALSSWVLLRVMRFWTR